MPRAAERTEDGKPIARAAALASGESITLDGRAADAIWARAAPVRWQTNYAGTPTGITTEVRFAYSSSALYMLWQLDRAGLNTDRSRPINVERSKLYTEDCVELFLAPNPTALRRYYEIEVGPFGHYLDLDVDLKRGRYNTKWSGDLEIATARDAAAGKATIEIAVRSKDIAGALKPGRSLPIGLFRIEGKKPRHYLAWSPARTRKPNFHRPEAFGRLRLAR